MTNIKEIVRHNRTIELPKSEIEKWNGYMSKDFVDYFEEGFAELSTVWCKTVKFSDGFEIDLKVCTNNMEDGDLWSEAVLFDEKGGEFCCTAIFHSIDGDWELEWFDYKTETKYIYTVTVKGV